MAGTRVRSLRESFALVAGELISTRHRLVPRTERLMDRDLLLLAFVAVQIVTCAVLIARDALDLGIAGCLSAGLITAAGVYASRQPRGRDYRYASAAAVAAHAATACDTAAAQDRLALDRVEASEAWADLMARISHEIRTPLNAVIGFSDLMEREIFGPLGHARYGDYAAHIKDSGNSLLKSAEDTLALSSLLAAPRPCERPQTTNLKDLIGDAWRPLEAQAERRGLTLDLAIAAGAEIAGERRVIRQAALNLLTEAINRAADGGCIAVEAIIAGDSARLSIATVTASRWLHERTPSLAVCLARALLERTGSALVICDDRASRSWRAMTVLDLPVQDDFFTARG